MVLVTGLYGGDYQSAGHWLQARPLLGSEQWLNQAVFTCDSTLRWFDGPEVFVDDQHCTKGEIVTTDFHQIDQWVDQAIASTPIYDLHTHLYPAAMPEYCLWGLDELLTYHYLIAETIRVSPISYEDFWRRDQEQQAACIWENLFVDRAPLSEACRGVVTVLHRLGLNLQSRNLADYRAWFKNQSAQQQIDRIFKLANVKSVVMTNDALDPKERAYWENGAAEADPRFKGVLRIDPVLLGWPQVARTLAGFGYQVGAELGQESLKEIRRFLTDWIKKMKALYVAVSLTPQWRYPDDSPATTVIKQCILPVCQEHNLPFALMVGVRRQVNPLLKLAGDSLGKSDIVSLDRLLSENPNNKFMCTMLSRENQHELAVTARKHRNLFLFGCWWFLNNPALIEEMTRMRMELLGEAFVPQHSDCRVLEQLLYKWDHSRRIIAKVMKDKFADLARSGWVVTQAEIQRTATRYLSSNFEEFLAR